MLPTHGNVDTWIGLAELASARFHLTNKQQIVNR
jgi:hypothetical protein